MEDKLDNLKQIIYFFYFIIYYNLFIDKNIFQ